MTLPLPPMPEPGDAETQAEVGTPSQAQPSSYLQPAQSARRPISFEANLPPARWKLLLFFGVISTGIHAFILNLSIPFNQQVSLKKPVKFTRLMKLPRRVSAVQPRSLAQPSPAVNPVAVSQSSVSISTPKPAMSEIQPSVVSPARQAVAPVQPPPKSPNLTQFTSSLTVKHQKADLALKDLAFKDFPPYPNATTSPETPASLTSDSFENVVKFFDGKLESPTPEWKFQVVASEPDRRVYQVIHGNASQFLSVLSKGSFGTAYILASQPTTQDALKQTDTAIESIGDILGSLKLEAVTASRTAQPKLFSTDNKIQSMNLTQVMPSDKVLQNLLSQPFRSQDFNVALLPQSYGGGPLYSIKRESFVCYLSLVPSEDGKGTVIVFWKEPPVTLS